MIFKNCVLCICKAYRGKEEWITKIYQETFGCDGYIHYPDCGDDFTGVYVCQIVSNCVF